jgi:hypothetical protein
MAAPSDRDTLAALALDIAAALHPDTAAVPDLDIAAVPDLDIAAASDFDIAGPVFVAVPVAACSAAAEQNIEEPVRDANSGAVQSW